MPGRPQLPATYQKYAKDKGGQEGDGATEDALDGRRTVEGAIGILLGDSLIRD